MLFEKKKSKIEEKEWRLSEREVCAKITSYICVDSGFITHLSNLWQTNKVTEDGKNE
jgi:hypothetical protein